MATATLDDDRLDATFAALANPTRRAILSRLAEGEASVGDLAEPFSVSLPAISKHIKVLEQAGLVTRSRAAQFRYCNLHAEPLAEVASWADQYRHIWEQRFDLLADYVHTISETDKTPGDHEKPDNHDKKDNETDE